MIFQAFVPEEKQNIILLIINMNKRQFLAQQMWLKVMKRDSVVHVQMIN